MKLAIQITVSDGSSPRVRGTPYELWQQHEKMRFIPAGAGNTVNR